ncbi:RES family NAD+ phosphorylase [Rhizobium sp. C4]|uniref:RES family NAD+ phosphorylase n=1 Tax=Rhizobium sp. C4 TaxID=1349800 RepID=UPI001E5EC19A|nr:RES family NAD+ phosphorylase [Rhizobium sp. C4]MCD2173756.1 RES family NAD+ phosphorylase [Rhizobium sp. C4]
MEIAISQLEWLPCYRIIPSRFPPIDLFERIAPPEDWEALIALEELTNDRIRQEVGDISLVPLEERVSGPGASVIMAAFTHLNPSGSRFADATFGAYYAAADVDTAIAETKFHRKEFLRATREAPIGIEMRVYLADMAADLHDVRGRAVDMPDIYRVDDYGASQALARRLRGQGSAGIAYDSVRREGGECVALFRPKTLGNVRQGAHLIYKWNGVEIGQVYELRS